MGWRKEELEADFVFACNEYGLTAPESWKLFEHIQENDGVIREYEVRLFFGIGQQKAEELIDKLVKTRFAIEDTIPSPDGNLYVDEITDDEAKLLAEIELGMTRPLWR
jgi:hypothetical protein